MNRIDEIVYEIAGEEITITVGDKGVSSILKNGSESSYHIFNADGFLYLEVFGVREVYYSGFPTDETDTLEDDLDLVNSVNF